MNLMRRRMEMKKYKAIDIALYVIHYVHTCNKSIDNLQLQKILFYIQLTSYELRAQPLFNDNIENWEYGFVVPKVYYEFNCYAMCKISDEYIDEIVFNNKNMKLERHKRYCNCSLFLQEDSWLINHVVDQYIDFSAMELSVMVRKLELYNMCKIGKVVTDDDIKKYLLIKKKKGYV